MRVVVKAFPRVACGSEVVLTASAVAAFAVCDGEAESRQEKISARVMLATRVLNIFRKICSVQKRKLVSQITLPEPKLMRNPDIRTNILFGNGYYSYLVTETGAPLHVLRGKGPHLHVQLVLHAVNSQMKQEITGGEPRV